MARLRCGADNPVRLAPKGRQALAQRVSAGSAYAQDKRAEEAQLPRRLHLADQIVTIAACLSSGL